MSDRDVWFRYWAYRGGVRAAPASWQGWVSLMGGLFAWLAIGVGLNFWIGSLGHPLFAGLASALVVFGGMTLTIVGLIKFKGRKA